MSGKVVVTSPEQMSSIARQFTEQLTGGEVVLLLGPLGAGKTTFVQGVARALGVTPIVTSPTFTIVADYDVPAHPAIRRLVHVDLYRLGNEQAAREPAVREALRLAKQQDHLTLVEWADKLGNSIPKGAQRISFEHGRNANERIITFINTI